MTNDGKSPYMHMCSLSCNTKAEVSLASISSNNCQVRFFVFVLKVTISTSTKVGHCQWLARTNLENEIAVAMKPDRR